MEYGTLSAMAIKFKNISKTQILNKFKICLQILKFKVCATKEKLDFKMFNKVLYLNIIMYV